MLALFVTTVASGIISSFVANRSSPDNDTVANTAIHTIVWPQELRGGAEQPRASAIPVAALAAIPGVEAVRVIHAAPDGDKPGVEPGLTLCAGLPAELGSCPPGTAVAGVYPDLEGPASLSQAHVVAPVWDASAVTPAELEKLPLLSVVVATDGSSAALETARTMLQAALPQARRAAATDNDYQVDSTTSFIRFQQLAAVVIAASLPIAGCSLAVSVAGGLTDRKRPFSMLRLTGVRLAELRRVVLLESVIPLLSVAVLAIGMGFVAAQLFLRAQLRYNLVAPAVSYYVLVVLGLALSVGIIVSTMPILRRITGPETARNE
jgi:hypothetical protein